MKTVLPSVFDGDDFRAAQIVGADLKDAETEIRRIPAKQQFVPTIASMCIILPAAQQVLRSVQRPGRGTHVIFSVGNVVDEIDAAPVGKRRPPARRNHSDLRSGQHQFSPIRKSERSQRLVHFHAPELLGIWLERVLVENVEILLIGVKLAVLLAGDFANNGVGFQGRESLGGGRSGNFQ